MADSVLSVADLSVDYSGVRAVDGLSLEIGPGEVFTVLGANGAGKTSTLRAVSRLIRSQSRVLSLAGQDLRRMSPFMAARRGLRHVPEGRRVFPQMSVRENLELGGIGTSRAQVAQRIEWVFEMFPRLRERTWQMAGLMSGGEQQMLAIGRALMREPTLLLLDEPSLGLSPEMMYRIYDALRRLKQEGVAMLLVEQNAEVALDFADRGCVLLLGRVAHAGTAQELRESSELAEAYLGSSDASARVRSEVVAAGASSKVPYRHLWRGVTAGGNSQC